MRIVMRTWLMAIAVMMGVSMSAGAGLFGFGGENWKEEVLLHDGSKIIVKRFQTRGGRHEPGQSPGVKEQNITFTIPSTRKSITFKSEYSEDVGHANFDLLALHILNGTPYIVTSPNLCLSYNKWGRPNPPYVIFKHDGKAWQRIQLSGLPAGFKTINLVIDTFGHRDVEQAIKSGFISTDGVNELNSSIKQPEYRTILREPLKPGSVGVSCDELVPIEGGWGSPGGAKSPIPIVPRNSNEDKK